MKQLFTLTFCFLILSNCSGSTRYDGLTPMPDNTDLPNALLIEAIDKFLHERVAPPNSEYDYARTDLNGDGIREGVVLFKLPHTYWCGWDGCGMVIFKAGLEGFTPLSTISNVRGPIHISNTRQNGWRDIIIRVSGAKMADKNVILQFDDKKGYPTNSLLATDFHFPAKTLGVETHFK